MPEPVILCPMLDAGSWILDKKNRAAGERPNIQHPESRI
jgi:hypothetical protein